jgi:hypothetical protein
MEPSDSVMIWTYIGDIEGRGEIDMLLNFTKSNEILGFAFDFEQVREYRVNGCVEDRIFTMWLQEENIVTAIILGEFPENDPRGHYSGVLSFDVITGFLAEKNSSGSVSIYVRLSSGRGGTMEHRFKIEGVKDDGVILNAAQQFLAAVANDDRKRIVGMIQFPVDVWFEGERKELQTPESFLAYYNAIFGGGFKERLTITFPNYILSEGGSFGGTYLHVYGGGLIGFDLLGKVVSIYNQDEPTPTPAITSGGCQ